MATKKFKTNIDPGRPIGRPMAPVATSTGWGKTLTKSELLGLVDRIYAKQKEDKMSKLSEAKLGTTYKSRPPKSEEHKRKISEAIKKKWQEKK